VITPWHGTVPWHSMKLVSALKVIGELSNLTLSEERQILVAELKKTAEQQAAKAAANGAPGRADDAFGGALGDNK